jgi:signal peptidase
MKLFFNIIYSVVFAVMLALALLFVSTLFPVFGVEAKVVKSGSMTPAISVGSLVVIHPAPVYKVGDVITFGKDTKTQIPTTHRIVAIKGEGDAQTFQTKGDANNAADPSLTKIADVHGKVVASIPYLGYLLAFARTPMGFALLVGLPALMVVVEEGYVIVREVLALRRKKAAAAPASPVRATPLYVAPRGKVFIDGVRPLVRGRRGVRIPVTHVVGAVLLTFVTAGLVMSVRGDTLAVYQDKEVSGANKFAAAAVYPSTEPAPVVQEAAALPAIDETSDTTETELSAPAQSDSPWDAFTVTPDSGEAQ